MTRIVFVVSVLLLLALSFVACADDPAAGSLASGADVVYADSFVAGESGEWFLEGDEAARASIIDERLLIEVDLPYTVQYASLEETPFTDFILEVDATQLAGSLDSSYGVLFRLTEIPGAGAVFYRFEVTGNGEYIVERRNSDGSWTRLTGDWQFSPALNQGLNVTNRLGVKAIGDIISVYSNDTLVAEVVDGGYEFGLLALDAGTFGQPGLQVAFDNLVIHSP